MSTIVVERAPVLQRTAAGPYAILEFTSPAIAQQARAGQFVNIEQNAPGHLLRRPFSILDATGDRFSVAFDAIGAGTAWLAGRRPGDQVGVVGPLGSSFTPPKPGVTALLVGGGYGAAPLFFFARTLRAEGVRTHLILGAATKARLFEPERAAGLVDALTVTTDDGSAGMRGVVTDAMREMKADAIYACGPMPMLAAISRAAGTTPCEVAVEEFMACGIGVCWTCVVPVKQNDGVRHARSCTDGPVFDGSAIAWA